MEGNSPNKASEEFWKNCFNEDNKVLAPKDELHTMSSEQNCWTEIASQRQQRTGNLTKKKKAKQIVTKLHVLKKATSFVAMHETHQTGLPTRQSSQRTVYLLTNRKAAKNQQKTRWKNEKIGQESSGTQQLTFSDGKISKSSQSLQDLGAKMLDKWGELHLTLAGREWQSSEKQGF